MSFFNLKTLLLLWVSWVFVIWAGATFGMGQARSLPQNAQQGVWFCEFQGQRGLLRQIPHSGTQELFLYQIDRPVLKRMIRQGGNFRWELESLDQDWTECEAHSGAMCQRALDWVGYQWGPGSISSPTWNLHARCQPLARKQLSLQWDRTLKKHVQTTHRLRKLSTQIRNFKVQLQSEVTLLDRQLRQGLAIASEMGSTQLEIQVLGTHKKFLDQAHSATREKIKNEIHRFDLRDY